MNEVKVSIIVSTYNGAKTLPKLIKSLLSQTLDSYEVILSDDCSTDETRDIIKNYAQKYPQKIIANYMESNTRGSGSYNYAFKLARGKYVAFIDQDDWVDKTMYEKLYSLAEKEEADVTDCIMEDVDLSGNELRISDNTTFDQIGEINSEKRKSLFVAPGSRLPKIFRKSFLINNSIYHCENVCFGDNYFMEIVAAYCNKMVKVNEPLYFYRSDNVSTTRSYNNPVLYDRVKSAKMMIESLSERGFLNDYRQEIEFRFIELFYVNSLVVFLSRFKPCEINEIRYLRNYVKQNYMNYRKNKYFMERISPKKKLLTFICDLNPWILCKIYEVYRILKSVTVK